MTKRVQFKPEHTFTLIAAMAEAQAYLASLNAAQKERKNG